MLNQIVVIGRLVQDPEIVELENGSKSANIKLAVPRSFKNEKGEYETDFIPVVLWNGVAENTKEYCHKGDLIGVKGRIEGQDDKVIVVAEKITFLSSKKEDEEE